MQQVLLFYSPFQEEALKLQRENNVIMEKMNRNLERLIDVLEKK